MTGKIRYVISIACEKCGNVYSHTYSNSPKVARKIVRGICDVCELAQRAREKLENDKDD